MKDPASGLPFLPALKFDREGTGSFLLKACLDRFLPAGLGQLPHQGFIGGIQLKPLFIVSNRHLDLIPLVINPSEDFVGLGHPGVQGDGLFQALDGPVRIIQTMIDQALA